MRRDHNRTSMAEREKARRLVSYPLSLALVVATLVTLTGGWIAWWNYRSGLANTRSLAFDLFGQLLGAKLAAPGEIPGDHQWGHYPSSTPVYGFLKENGALDSSTPPLIP